ncbi:MAG: DciA family protein [Corynebacterium sp.]|uniref:DciA family protein n=1 Tax=Corynebacterium sp. TaxID=1720 RepID=UPI0026DAD410|nr:DciA family protein [Corynebacterium sp.]MDO5098601.1 DciA family protein [Corynebacterium sp.]
MSEAEENFEDSVAATFKRMREEAKNRGGKLPDLAAPAAANRASTSRNRDKKPRELGRPTGKDGRYIPYGQTSLEGFGALVQREIRNRGWSKPIAGGWVHSHWPELVGEHVAAHTKVEMLKDKALFITCDSTAWATNLRMMQRQILQTIAQKVGPDVVVELKIFGPKTPSWRFGSLHVKGRGPRDTYG